MKLYYWLLVFVLCGCTNTNNNKTTENKLEASKNEMIILDNRDVGLNLSALSEEFPNSFSGQIYIANTECSKCIATLANYIKLLIDNKYNGKLLVIIAQGSQPIFNYYLKEFDLYGKINLTVKEENNNKWITTSLDEENRKVYFVESNQIKNIYQYWDE